jgi:cell division protein FtsL
MTEPITVPRPTRRPRPAEEANRRPRPAGEAGRRPRPAREPAASARPAREPAASARPARDAVSSALARKARSAQPASSIPARARPSAARAAAAAHLAGSARATGAAASIHALPLEHRRRVPGLRHLWVVPAPIQSPVQRGRRRRLLLLGGIGLFMAVAFGLVYLHVVLAQRQFALDRLTTKVQAESATYQNLRLKVAQLGSPQQVISTAEGKLGMRQPASVTYLSPTVTIPGEIPAAVTTAASGSGSQAPAGDADWPQIKSQLAGSP